jgi:hypothetical protein
MMFWGLGAKRNPMDWPKNLESVMEKFAQDIPIDGLVLLVQ